MTGHSALKPFDMAGAVLEPEWMITIDTPEAGVSSVLAALERGIPLKQGPYDCCSYVRGNGLQRFRCLEGSHAGAEGTIQETPAAQIVISIACDETLLRQVFDTVFRSHVNEEPTIRVQQAWGSRSKLINDIDNPNRYWNRADAATLHGTPVTKTS